MWSKNKRGRGRPVDAYYSQSDIKLLRYLALITVKYDIDSDHFFETIVKAWQQKRSSYNDLEIACRKDLDGQSVFIITKKDKVITQFRIPEYLLQEKNPIREFEASVRPPTHYRTENDQKPIFIKDLKAGMKKVHVRATILELPETREVLTRFGSYARLSNATLEDSTGSIKLALWNKQIDTVSIGDHIAIDNAKVVWFRGEPQLRIGRQGELKVIPNEDFSET
jgi:replication factor A1